jgi:uncharacterized protein YuzE
MKVIYDPETDVLDLIFSEDSVEESDEVREGVIVDYSKSGGVVSIEILDASKKVKDPKSIQYEIKPLKVA